MGQSTALLRCVASEQIVPITGGVRSRATEGFWGLSSFLMVGLRSVNTEHVEAGGTERYGGTESDLGLAYVRLRPLSVHFGRVVLLRDRGTPNVPPFSTSRVEVVRVHRSRLCWFTGYVLSSIWIWEFTLECFVGKLPKYEIMRRNNSSTVQGINNKWLKRG